MRLIQSISQYHYSSMCYRLPCTITFITGRITSVKLFSAEETFLHISAVTKTKRHLNYVSQHDKTIGTRELP